MCENTPPLLIHNRQGQAQSKPIGTTGYAVVGLHTGENGSIEPSDLQTHRPEKAVLALGYSGWGAGQLESETEAGIWTPASISLDDLLSVPSEKRWEIAAASAGLIAAQVDGKAKIRPEHSI
jgi:putative AlgH/UPF0301 family transcriptional regulator